MILSLIGKHADYYASQAAKAIAGPTEVIGASTKDCFEMALQKTSPYVGESADFYMRPELANYGFIPTVISPEDFERLLTSLPTDIPLQE